ncbi:MAG: lysophospholipid acyltransferase family protein [Spirochaetia bacterium]|nr:lysophospholipid acyltransferase family protein [Spirochaetia bacterium]
MKKFKEWIVQHVALPAVVLLIKAFSLTYSFKELNGEGVTPHRKKTKQYIYAFWHCYIIAPVVFYRNLGVASLVSLSRDGAIAAKIAESFGFKIVRGSTFKGAAQGLLAMKQEVDRGADVAINTDGPRGPAESVGNGAVYLAKLTGKEIVPFGFYCDKMIRLTSWDRFMIILPFSRGVFKFGEPVGVAYDADENAMEKARALVEAKLKELNTDCEQYLKGGVK